MTVDISHDAHNALLTSQRLSSQTHHTLCHSPLFTVNLFQAPNVYTLFDACVSVKLHGLLCDANSTNCYCYWATAMWFKYK